MRVMVLVLAFEEMGSGIQLHACFGQMFDRCQTV